MDWYNWIFENELKKGETSKRKIKGYSSMKNKKIIRKKKGGLKMETKYWRTGLGDLIKIEDMERDHIVNIIEYLENKNNTWIGEHTSNSIDFYKTAKLYSNEYIEMNTVWINIFREELKKRDAEEAVKRELSKRDKKRIRKIDEELDELIKDFLLVNKLYFIGDGMIEIKKEIGEKIEALTEEKARLTRLKGGF